jgi:hypothetical protein
MILILHCDQYQGDIWVSKLCSLYSYKLSSVVLYISDSVYSEFLIIFFLSDVKLTQMVQQTIESKFSEYGMGNTENDLPTRDKQLLVSVKKTVLRDLQNDNRIMVPNSIGNSPLLKDKGPVSDATKVSGAKRASPERPVSPPHHQSQSSNAANGHLVYVRRKSEAELGKSSTGDSASINSDCLQSRQLDHPDETTQPNSQEKEPKASSFPTFAPFPMAASISSSGKPSDPHLLGKPGIRSAPAESNYHPVASAGPSLSNPKGLKNLQWEERYHQLQMLLRKLDESDQDNYLQSKPFYVKEITLSCFILPLHKF